jgi:hypothetical protein
MNSGGSITERIELGSVSLSVSEVSAIITTEHSRLPTLFLYGAWGAFLREFPPDDLPGLLP